MTVVEVVVVVVEGAVVVVIEIAVTVVVVVVVMVEDAVAMVGSAGGSGSGIEVVLVVPSVVVVEGVEADRLAPRRRNVCLDKKLTCFVWEVQPFLLLYTTFDKQGILLVYFC